MKKCRQCGTLLDESVNTCTMCGIDNPFEKEKKCYHCSNTANDPKEYVFGISWNAISTNDIQWDGPDQKTNPSSAPNLEQIETDCC